MSQRFHRALLRAASLLVRTAERAEWLAEWHAELWYVTPGRRTAFCLGAIRDAFWMRRHTPAPVRLQSPWECLGVLAVLATLSVFFALVLSLPREMFFAHDVPHGLVMVSRISFDDYRRFPAASADVAFLGGVRFHAGNLPVALASRNLSSLIRLPLAAIDPDAAPLIVTRSAWRWNFASDPRIVGRRLNIGGRAAQVAAVISDSVWRLPGYAEAWLLVDEPTLAAESRGYAVAVTRSRTSSVSIPRLDGGVDRFTCIPLAEPMLVPFLLIMAMGGAILPAVTRFSLGRYPPSPRRWAFLGAKIIVMIPIILFGSVDVLSLIAPMLQPHAVLVGTVIGFRWILMDQRRRCPVCLRVLTHPTPIGEPSRTLLEWYGTELVCTRGHGLLHVPEIRTSYTEQRWLRLDSSWSSLF